MSEATKNSAGPAPLRGQATGIQVSVKDQKKVREAFHEFPDHCPACGGTLHHKDLVGNLRGPVFHVKGFVCPACNYRRGKPQIKNAAQSCVFFQWQKLDMPLKGTSSCRGDSS